MYNSYPYTHKVLTTLLVLIGLLLGSTAATADKSEDSTSLQDTVSRSTMKKASKALTPQQRDALEHAFSTTHDSKLYKVEKKLLKYRCGKDGVCQCNFAFNCVDMAMYANCEKKSVKCNFVSCECKQQSSKSQDVVTKKKKSSTTAKHKEVEEKKPRKKPASRRQTNL